MVIPRSATNGWLKAFSMAAPCAPPQPTTTRSRAAALPATSPSATLTRIIGYFIKLLPSLYVFRPPPLAFRYGRHGRQEIAWSLTAGPFPGDCAAELPRSGGVFAPAGPH